MVLKSESKLYQHPKSRTLYLTIPSKLANDSAFPFHGGDRVSVIFEPNFKRLIVMKKRSCKR